MERYLGVVLPALVRRGCAVHVLARRIDDVPAGVTATRVDWADERATPDSSARAAVGRVLRTIRPDAAVAHNVMDAGVVEALRAAPRFAYHVHDHRPFCPNGDRVFPRTGRICIEPLGAPCALHALTDGCAYGPRRRTLRLIARRERLRDAIAAADAAIVASAYVADRAASSAIPRERIVEIPLPLSDAAYADLNAAPHPDSRSGSAATSDEPGAARTVVFAGRIVPQKGLRSLIRAVARIDPSRRPRVRALGSGPDLDAAVADAAALGVSLAADGAVDESALRRALDEAALLALPSLWAEPFAYVGIEAFARSRPVVAYDVGGIRSWLRDGMNGMLAPAADEARLAAAMSELLENRVQCGALGRQARHDAETYRVTGIVGRLLNAYAEFR